MLSDNYQTKSIRRTPCPHPQGRGTMTHHASGLPQESLPFGPHSGLRGAHVSPTPDNPTGAGGRGSYGPVTSRRDAALDQSTGYAPEGGIPGKVRRRR